MRNRIAVTATLVLALALGPVTTNAIPLIGAWQGAWIQFPGVSGSVDMTITDQVASGPDFLLQGHFDWLCELGTTCSGREEFSGTLVGDLFTVSGFNLVNPVNLALSTYVGTVSADGQSISGTFGGEPPRGTWLVSKIPAPASLALLGIGLAGLGFVRKKKAH